ncbi:unnamed protein product [Haemonchus placei]|uniref:Uncharacterized protein n=1 Tax=Haemonchus placei TaxID=6290 RepID=A0A0N4WYK5_HAEPC|nr:unnamed protein product [Haemonchus placei]
MREDRARKRRNSDCDPASMSLSVVAPPTYTLSQVICFSSFLFLS